MGGLLQRDAGRGAWGVTTLVDMPLNCNPPTTTVAAYQAKLAAARGQLHVDVGFWGGVIPGNLAELGPLWDLGVLGFKAFMCPSGIDEFPAASVDDLAAVLTVLASRQRRCSCTLDRHRPCASPIPTPTHACTLHTSRRALPKRKWRRFTALIGLARSTHATSPHRAPGSPPRPFDASRGSRLRRPNDGRDVPPLSAFCSGRRADGWLSIQVRSSDPFRRGPRRTLGWTPLGHDRSRRDGPLALSSGAQADGNGGLYSGVGRDRVTSALAVHRLEWGTPPWLWPRRHRSLDVRGSSRTRRAPTQGNDSSRERCRPGAVRYGERVGR